MAATLGGTALATINGAIAGKADTSHTHATTDITSFDSAVNALIAAAIATEVAARDAAIAAAVAPYLLASNLGTALTGLGGVGGSGTNVTSNSSGLVTAIS